MKQPTHKIFVTSNSHYRILLKENLG